jgi:hypothetical protein
VWMGFAPDEIATGLAAVGLEHVRIEVQTPAQRGRDLPATFIADARRPPERAR